jgi:hypothetical protein
MEIRACASRHEIGGVKAGGGKKSDKDERAHGRGECEWPQKAASVEISRGRSQHKTKAARDVPDIFCFHLYHLTDVHGKVVRQVLA